MYLHLGRDIAVPHSAIVCIFDMDTATFSKHTKSLLAKAEKRGQVFVVTEELPRSAVICMENGQQVVYISQISSQTLLKRSKGEVVFDNLI